MPPFVQSFPNMTEVSYHKLIVPELLWIALLVECYGAKEGTRLALHLGTIASETGISALTGSTSSYASLDETKMSQIVQALDERRNISLALAPLATLYPECPLRFVCLEEHLTGKSLSEQTNYFMKVLEPLYNRNSKESMMMQAGFIYIAFVTDKLKVFQGTSLAKFPEIEHYPDTPESLEVASGVRGTINVLLGIDVDDQWPRYFWNRGLELSECRLGGQE